MTFLGKNVLITGASRGLGYFLAETLAKRGASLALCARDTSPMQPLLEKLRAEGATVHALSFDVGDKDAIYPLAGSAAALLGPIDVVIHNASTLGRVPLPLLVDTECEDLERVLAVNLLGPFRLSKALVGSMVLRGSGLLVHISSDAAVNAYPTWGSYGVSKAALDHLSRTWDEELWGTGVRSLSIDPGEMDTQMHRDALPEADPTTLAQPAAVALRIVDLLENVSATHPEKGTRVAVQS